MNDCVKKFNADYHYETFKTREHLQSMVYAQINEIRSLRTLEVALNSQKIGIKTKISRSTLSDANTKRPAQVFFGILEQLMFLLPNRRCKGIKKIVRILDSSPIQLRGKGYDEWAKQYATRHIQGLKLHLEFDLGTKSPTRTAISYANCNDSSMGQRWPLEAEVIYIFDKGYCDFNWWWSIHEKGAYFVTRLKKNTAIVIQRKDKINSETILGDDTFKFKNKKPRGGKTNLYTEDLRRISVRRKKKNPLILVTNLYDMPAEMIAKLYKARWEIELFFKWMKQNLKLKKFLGKSANAVKIQIATALIAFLLVQIFKINTNGQYSLQLVLTWVRHNLHVKMAAVRKQGPPICRLKKSLANMRTAYL